MTDAVETKFGKSGLIQMGENLFGDVSSNKRSSVRRCDGIVGDAKGCLEEGFPFSVGPQRHVEVLKRDQAVPS